MKPYDWSTTKNDVLKIERGICFDDVVVAANEGRILKVTDHPNQKKYPGQMIMIIEIDNYAYVVPYIEDKEKIFLKTVYPSREATKKYIIKKNI